MTVVKAKKNKVMLMAMPPQPWPSSVLRAAMVYSTPGCPNWAASVLKRNPPVAGSMM